MSRPKLLKIRLIYSVEGSQVPLEIDVDPCRTTSLFFDEQAAVEILGAFYDDQGKTITRDQAIARFGTRAEAWFPKGKDELPLNKKFLKLAWGTEMQKPRRSSSVRVDPRADVNGLPMIICKDPSCMPTGYP